MCHYFFFRKLLDSRVIFVCCASTPVVVVVAWTAICCRLISPFGCVNPAIRAGYLVEISPRDKQLFVAGAIKVARFYVLFS